MADGTSVSVECCCGAKATAGGHPLDVSRFYDRWLHDHAKCPQRLPDDVDLDCEMMEGLGRSAKSETGGE